MARFFRSFFSPSEQEGRVYDDKNRTGVMYKSAYNRIQDAGNCQDNCGKIQSFLLLKRPAGETLPGVFVCGRRGIFIGAMARGFWRRGGRGGGLTGGFMRWCAGFMNGRRN